MEAQVNVSGGGGGGYSKAEYEANIAAMLASVKEAAERQLYLYKQEVEMMLSKNVSKSRSEILFISCQPRTNYCCC